MFNYYSYIKDEDDEGNLLYHFVTSNNTVYTVYFNFSEYADLVNDFPLLLNKGYAFGFRKNTSLTEKKQDPLVFKTIYTIVADFLSDSGPETTLLYHCDISDNKQAQRNKLFSNWERITPPQNGLVKHSVEVQIDNFKNGNMVSFFLGFITSLNNPLLDNIRSEFEYFSIYIIQPKE